MYAKTLPILARKRFALSHHRPLPQWPLAANVPIRTPYLSGASKPLDFPNLIDLGAAWGFDLYRLAPGLTDQRTRDG
jgi:hypothetical protein